MTRQVFQDACGGAERDPELDGALPAGTMRDTEPGRDRPARLRIAFGPTTSPALPAAIRAAQAVPGYRVEAAGRRVRHVVDTALPFADPDTWQRLRVVIDTVGRWTARHEGN